MRGADNCTDATGMKNADEWSDTKEPAEEVTHSVAGDDEERGARLKQARLFRGFKNATKPIAAMGVAKSTYYDHEAGKRGMTDETVVRYARFYRVRPEWLWEGIGNMLEGVDTSRVPVVGSITGVGDVKYSIVPHDTFVNAPGSIDSRRGKALSVADDTTRPTYRKGDTAFYDDIMQGDEIRRLVGQECVVCLADGRSLIREIGPGSREGLWSITLYGVPEYDIAIQWAAKVKHIERA